MSPERAIHETMWVMGPEEGILGDSPEPVWPYSLGSSSSILPASYLTQTAVPHQLGAGSRMNQSGDCQPCPITAGPDVHVGRCPGSSPAHEGSQVATWVGSQPVSSLGRLELGNGIVGPASFLGRQDPGL